MVFERGDRDQADAILWEATGGPETKEVPPAERKAGSLLSLRRKYDLYANLRPIKNLPGVKARYQGIDLIVVRENTEGFYADRNMEQGNGEVLVTSDVVISLRRITRLCC